MRQSIKKQLTFIFLGLIVSILLACFFVNVFFLGKYYVANKEESLHNMYHQLEVCLEQDVLTTDQTQLMLQGLVEKSNISFMIQDTEGQVIIATNNDKEWLQIQLFSYQFNKNNNKIKLIDKSDVYEIWTSKDPRTRMEYIEMWGYFPEGEAFILRTPMESIQESVALANRFLLYVGTVLIFVSILFIRYFTKRITDPILELARLSKRMTELDFDAKYVSGGDNEIGMLGNHFNIMTERLETTISELKTANNELQKDLENKEKAETMRSEFLSNVSHELKTPIALIQGYAEGLQDGISDDPESREFYCEVIRDEAEKMNQLVKNLLELNHLEYNNEDLQMERFDIQELIRGVVQSLEIVRQQKNVELILTIPEEPCIVWGDQFKVEHVIRNYLTNALNHVDGEQIIHVKVEPLEKMRISVFNTGKPIPEADIERIWEKFYKVDKARTREYGGNGIGLSVVKAIMETLHQGYGVKNYDNGVEFWFELDRK